jgi:hypothetical protein
MSKPLFRFTVGPCLQQGLDILAESFKRTTRAFGADYWDWVVCYNGLNKTALEFLQKAAEGLPIQFIPQSWATCPIDDHCQTPQRKDGTFEWNGNRCGGTLWKVCPPRLRMETHEIVMDNDVVVLKKFSQVDEWLRYDDRALVLEEPIRFYGRYDCLFAPEGPFLNSGFMGFPPGYDFGQAINQTWARYGKYENLSQADEQGLLTYSLSQEPNIRIQKEQMVEVLKNDYRTKLTGREFAIHFTQANRIPHHHQWKKYNEIIGNNVII